jgi:hypothetical protein
MQHMGSKRSARFARAGVTCGKTKAVQLEKLRLPPLALALSTASNGNANDPTKSCHRLAPGTAYVSIPAQGRVNCQLLSLPPIVVPAGASTSTFGEGRLCLASVPGRLPTWEIGKAGLK